MKKFIALFLILSVSLCLCGCYDIQEIDKSAYVIALGIDRGNSGFNYTFQISAPLAMGGGGEIKGMGEGEENTRVENIVIGAENLNNARTTLNNFLSKKINLSHLKIIVISESVAKKSLKPHLPFLLREREVRPNTRLSVSRGSAEDFLKGINPALEANTAEYYDLVFENGGVFAPSKTLWEFVNEEETFASALPLGTVSEYEESKDFADGDSPMRISSSKSEFSGLCLFKDYSLAGTLTPMQSMIFGLLSGKTKDAEISLSYGENTGAVRIFPDCKSKFSILRNDEATTVVLNANFSAELSYAGSVITANTIKDYLEKEAYSLFAELQKSGCDIFGIGNRLKRQCKTVAEWESLDWNNEFKNVYFLPEITVTLTKTDFGTA